MWLITIRTAHFIACLLFFGIFAFDRFVVSAPAGRPSEIVDYWQSRARIINLVLLPLITVSGAAWFVLVAMAMSGQSLQIDILKTVWTQTEFGTVWKIRLIFFLIATAAATVARFLKSPALKKYTIWFQLALSACLLGSLAWAGHGQESSLWHLFADVLHLLAAGLWPAGLLPLFLLLRKSRRLADTSDQLSMAVLVHRFSIVSLTTISLLTVTGFANSWFLVGSFPNLFSQPYGHWLLVKIILFCGALVVASVNLLRLKPRLVTENLSPEKTMVAVAQLQTNVQLELFLGLAIIVIVAILGILPPAIQ